MYDVDAGAATDDVPSPGLGLTIRTGDGHDPIVAAPAGENVLRSIAKTCAHIPVMKDIATGTAGYPVGVRTADQPVLAGTAGYSVGSITRKCDEAAAVAVYSVVAFPAAYRVVTVVPFVLAGAGVHRHVST